MPGDNKQKARHVKQSQKHVEKATAQQSDVENWMADKKRRETHKEHVTDSDPHYT
jgi:hypothetical protein